MAYSMMERQGVMIASQSNKEAIFNNDICSWQFHPDVDLSGLGIEIPNWMHPHSTWLLMKQ